MRLPPGFRFHPTDEELVVQYLKRKVLCCPLPAAVIPVFDLCKSDPWDLPGDKEQERYFFSTREAKYANGNRSSRGTASGYWKATGIDKQIGSCRGGGGVVGMKKTLVFYHGKAPRGARTDWIMHEYRLANAPINHKDDWVLCRIFLKKRAGAKKNEGEETNKTTTNPIFYNFMERERADLNLAPASSSSSGSSGITVVSAFNRTVDEHEEESSSCCNSSVKRKPY
ncbi:unnamed protein product [Cuscuta campestris]|uniref:NAC domain-containing protein n=2 Tax=Cuscuta sect. Cleistogrammica TaxID=1824901 RepID=A0A484MNF7_9ASTE|nr:hypothetical protein DM860_013713 [Cuscuta australis]VFQ90523.1 unnamed protein product [Cuscuta campestris]